jgi:hypothetical protein
LSENVKTGVGSFTMAHETRASETGAIRMIRINEMHFVDDSAEPEEPVNHHGPTCMCKHCKDTFSRFTQIEREQLQVEQDNGFIVDTDLFWNNFGIKHNGWKIKETK